MGQFRKLGWHQILFQDSVEVGLNTIVPTSFEWTQPSLNEAEMICGFWYGRVELEVDWATGSTNFWADTSNVFCPSVC